MHLDRVDGHEQRAGDLLVGEALRRQLDEAGLTSQGNPVGWGEAYRVWKECKVNIGFSSVEMYLPDLDYSL